MILCLLCSTRPLFGSLLARLELITHAYFNERNFSNVTVLRTRPHQLRDKRYHTSPTIQCCSIYYDVCSVLGALKEGECGRLHVVLKYDHATSRLTLKVAEAE